MVHVRDDQVTFFGREPAAILYALQSLLAVAVAFGWFGLTEESAGWVMTIANGVASLIVAVLTRPVVIGAITAAFQTILTGLVSFGLPLTQEQSGALIAALSVILGLLLRQSVTPAAVARRGS